MGKSITSNETEYYLRNGDEVQVNNLPKKVVQNIKLLEPKITVYGTVKIIIIDLLRGQNKRLTTRKIIDMTRLYDLSNLEHSDSTRRGVRRAIYGLNDSGILTRSSILPTILLLKINIIFPKKKLEPVKDIILDVLRKSAGSLMTGEIIRRSKASASRLGDRSIRKSLVILLRDQVVGRTKVGSSQRYFLRNPTMIQ